MDFVNLGIIAYFVGGIFSVLYPYLITWLETKEAFDWRLVVSRVLGVSVAGLLAIAVPGFVERLSEIAGNYDYPALYFLAVASTTYAAGDIGRKTEKLVSVIRK